MRTPFIAYITALITMGVLDSAWLGFSVNRIYKPGIGHLMAAKPVIPAAAAFYLIYAAGLTYLVTLPALASGGLGCAVLRGAVLGLVAYGTYDLTSLAVMQSWPLNLTLIDMLWGTILTGAAAGVAFLVTQRLG